MDRKDTVLEKIKRTLQHHAQRKPVGKINFKDLDMPAEQTAQYNALRAKGYSKNKALAILVGR
jgi:hypothetical protein